MNANCEAPVNITRESAQVCSTDRPAAPDTAPNDAPYSPVARPTPSPSRTIARRSASVGSLTRPTLGRAADDRSGEGCVQAHLLDLRRAGAVEVEGAVRPV